MKKSLFLLLIPLLLLGACNQNTPTPNGNPGDDDEEIVDPNYSVNEIVFSEVLSNDAAELDLTSLASPLSISGVTITFAQNSGSNAPKYFSDKGEARIYLKNSFTVSIPHLTRIDFLFNGEKGNGVIESNVGTYVVGGSSTARWTSDTEVESATFTMTKDQKRMYSMIVTTGKGPKEKDDYYPKDTANSYTVDFEHLGLTNSIQPSNSGFVNTITGYFAKERTELSNFAYTGSVQLYHKAQTYQKKVYETLAFVCGSANYDGSITLTFSKQLKKVKLYCSPNYAFAYDKDSGEYVPSYDGYCCLTVNNEDWVLGSYDSTKGPEKSSKEFTVNGTTLTLSGKMSQRVYIYALTFTF